VFRGVRGEGKRPKDAPGVLRSKKERRFFYNNFLNRIPCVKEPDKSNAGKRTNCKIPSEKHEKKVF